MIALLSVLLVDVVLPPARAETLQSVPPSAQPLADLGSLLDRVTPFCGRELAASEEDGALTFQLEVCDVVLVPDLGLLSVQVLGEPTGKSELFGQEELDRRAALDVDLLETLGFDPSEFAAAGTGQVGVQDRDVGDGGALPPARYISSKTLIERQIEGHNVLANRAIVTRDQAGNLLKINAAWPSFDDSSLLVVSDTLESDIAEAANRTHRPVMTAEAVIIVSSILDNVVVSGLLCVEVLRQLEGPHGGGKPSAVYYLDGERIKPLEVAP